MALSSRSFGSMVKRTPASPLLLMPRALVSHFVDTALTVLLNVMAPLELHYDLRALTKIIPCAPAISCSLHVHRTSF